MKKARTTTGKAESKSWRKEATLRDLINLLDEIESLDNYPEERAKLRQRVIDYGQWLSEQIFLGKKEVPESDDNQTIKEFNNRFYSTYDTKSESSYEEAKLPKGYYDDKGKFIRVPSSKPKKGRQGALNPRWHPIPPKEKDGKIIPPVTTKTGDTPTKTDDENILYTTNETSSDNNKRGIIPWWIMAPILGTALTITYRQCTSGEAVPPTNDEVNKDTTEVVTKTYTPAEQEYLRYTVEKGKGLLAKQLGIKDEKVVSELYDLCVENIKQGKIPEPMKELAEKYQMSNMIIEDLGIDLKNEPAIEATGYLLMAKSYEKVQKPIIDALTQSKDLTTKETAHLQKCLSLANETAKKHNVGSNRSQAFTPDYGLFGADKETERQIYKTDWVAYQRIVNRAFKTGKGY